MMLLLLGNRLALATNQCWAAVAAPVLQFLLELMAAAVGAGQGLVVFLQAIAAATALQGKAITGAMVLIGLILLPHALVAAVAGHLDPVAMHRLSKEEAAGAA